MQYYNQAGYLDFRKIRDLGYPFNLIIGGRGTGKTYGALESSIVDGKIWCYMRRTQTQTDIINKPEFSPLRPICRDRGWSYTMRSIAKGLSGAYPFKTDEKGKETISGPQIGFTCALSTIANVRGFDASSVDLIIYDEFIPEKGERPLQHEDTKLFNCYETMNRNRELQGRAPLQLFCLANSNDLTAPLLESLHLIKRIDRMKARGQEYFVDKERGLFLLLLRDSPISLAKSETALYKLTSGTDYAEMALDNDFSYEDRGAVVSRPLAEYKPLAAVGEICLYKHKAENRYYISAHTSGSPPRFSTSPSDIERFRRAFGWCYRAYMDERIEFEDYLCQVLFLKYIG